MTNRLKRPKWNMYPVSVDNPEGKLCAISTCIRDVKWKILDAFYCQDHITHPKQEKFPFIEGLKNGETNQVERQGEEGSGSVPRAGHRRDNRGLGEGLLSELRSGEQQAGQLVGAQLDSEAGQAQVGEADGAGDLLPDEAMADPFDGQPEEDEEDDERDPFGVE